MKIPGRKVKTSRASKPSCSYKNPNSNGETKCDIFEIASCFKFTGVRDKGI